MLTYSYYPDHTVQPHLLNSKRQKPTLYAFLRHWSVCICITGCGCRQWSAQFVDLRLKNFQWALLKWQYFVGKEKKQIDNVRWWPSWKHLLSEPSSESNRDTRFFICSTQENPAKPQAPAWCPLATSLGWGPASWQDLYAGGSTPRSHRLLS